MFSERSCGLQLSAAAWPWDRTARIPRARDGRPFPGDEHANDVVHRQTEFVHRQRRCKPHKICSENHADFVSSGVVANRMRSLGFHKAFLVRDPDGHAVRIEEK